MHDNPKRKYSIRPACHKSFRNAYSARRRIIDPAPGFSLPLWGLSATTSIALRNSWGVFRIGFAYLDYGEAL